MIIVSGLPGAGKTFFASRLSQEIDAEYISSELVRYDMAQAGQYPFDDELNVYEDMARRAAHLLRRGKSVVVDATFYRAEMRNMFLTLARLLHEKVVYIMVVADEDLIHQRLHGSYHPETSILVYEQLKPQYEDLENTHMVLESKTDNLNEMLIAAKEHIRTVQFITGKSSSKFADKDHG